MQPTVTSVPTVTSILEKLQELVSMQQLLANQTRMNAQTALFEEQLKVCDPDKLKYYFESSGIPEKLQQSFVTPSGTAKMKDAKIIFLGDSNHYDERQKYIRHLFIVTVAKPGDIVVVEAKPAMQPIKNHDVCLFAQIFTGKKIEVFGWDDMESYKASLEQGAKEDKLFQLRNNIKDKTSQLFNDTIMAIATVNEELRKLTRKRDQSLVKTVKAFAESRKKSRIFVTAGSFHFFETVKEFENDKYLLLHCKRTEGAPTKPASQANLPDNDLMVLSTATATKPSEGKGNKNSNLQSENGIKKS